jgi:hypothetical protein
MRIGFVLTSIVLALALGFVAEASERGLLTRTLVIGLVPAIWGVSHALARLTGRDMWHFAAPYPYRRMRDGGETALPRPDVSRESVHKPAETDERSPLPLAA